MLTVEVRERAAEGLALHSSLVLRSEESPLYPRLCLFWGFGNVCAVYGYQNTIQIVSSSFFRQFSLRFIIGLTCARK